jgi:hypothetical protein
MPMLNSRLVVPALLVAGAAWGMEPARAFSAPAPASRELPHAGQPFAGASPASQPRFVNPADVEHRLFNFDIENSLVYSFVVLTSSLGAAAIGFRLQRTAPFASLSNEHRSASRAALGLATFLTSIIIGIVANDAISSFDQANLNIQGWAVDLLSLDKVLKSYGPDAMAIRKQLRDDVRYRIIQIQSRESYADADYQATKGLPRVEILFRNVASLNPKDSIQRELRSRALSMIGGTASFGVKGNMAEKRWLFTVGDTKAPEAIYCLVVLSLGLEFFCFGLLTKPHRLTYLSNALAAMVIAMTTLIIVELDNPMDGFFTVDVEPLQKAELLMNQ